MAENLKNVKGTATGNVNEVNGIRKKQRIDNFVYVIILLYIYDLYIFISLYLYNVQAALYAFFSYSAFFSKGKNTNHYS